jgi:hypothetical protein
MVHVTSQSRYGAINTYKANTYGFNRVFRAILAVLEELSDTYECSPEGALALIRPHLTLGELEVVDEPMDIDIRHDEEGLKRYLQKAHLGRQGFLLQVVDLLVRLQTRDGYDALSQIELAAIHARGTLQSVSAVSEKPSGSETSIVLENQNSTPKRTFRTRKAATSANDEDISKSVQTETKPTKRTTKPRSQTTQTKDPSGQDDLGQLLKRSRDTLAKTKETLAQTGQVVTTNPLLNDFI